MQAIKPKSISDVVTSKAGSLATIADECGTEQARAMVVYLITDLCGFFNVPRNMDAKQVGQTTLLIFDCYPHFTPEDFIRCFDNIKKLKYGKIYESMDGAKILEFMAQYDEERSSEIRSYYEKQATEKRSKPLEVSDDFLKLLKDVTEKLNKPKVIAIVKRERTPEEKILDAYIVEFEELYKKQDLGDFPSIRLVTYKKKKLSVSEYVNLRFEEDSK